MLKRKRTRRKAAAATEFALIAPIVTLLVIGLCEMGQAISGANRIASAIREGGRLASMDFTGKLDVGQTANDKVTTDILNFLAATDIDTSGVDVEIEYADGPESGAAFDLAAEDNYLRLFRVRVTVPYENVSTNPLKLMNGQTIRAETVFRRGRTPVDYDI